MRMILSPKDSNSKLELLNVETYAQEGTTLMVVFADNVVRNYPLQHLWYYQAEYPKSEKTRIVRTNGNGLSEALE